MQTSDSKFDEFWRASELDAYNMRDFADLQEAYSASEKPLSLIEYPKRPQALPKPKNAAYRIAHSRNSRRDFANKNLSLRELSVILSSFASIKGLEHRLYPSAGAAYATEIYAFCLRSERYCGQILYYNPDRHAVTDIGVAPPWSLISEEVNVTVSGIPQLVVLFVLKSNRQTEKYGERGGRFALIEVGAAMQQLALHLAADKNLKGVAAGGLKDKYWLDLLNLQSSEYKLALGYLCGK